jgi:hypothetical protein
MGADTWAGREREERLTVGHGGFAGQRVGGLAGRVGGSGLLREKDFRKSNLNF